MGENALSPILCGSKQHGFMAPDAPAPGRPVLICAIPEPDHQVYRRWAVHCDDLPDHINPRRGIVTLVYDPTERRPDRRWFGSIDIDDIPVQDLRPEEVADLRDRLGLEVSAVTDDQRITALGYTLPTEAEAAVRAQMRTVPRYRAADVREWLRKAGVPAPPDPRHPDGDAGPARGLAKVLLQSERAAGGIRHERGWWIVVRGLDS